MSGEVLSNAHGEQANFLPMADTWEGQVEALNERLAIVSTELAEAEATLKHAAMLVSERSREAGELSGKVQGLRDALAAAEKDRDAEYRRAEDFAHHSFKRTRERDEARAALEIANRCADEHLRVRHQLRQALVDIRAILTDGHLNTQAGLNAIHERADAALAALDKPEVREP